MQGFISGASLTTFCIKSHGDFTELKEFLAGELCVVVRDDGVRYSKAMDDVEEE